MLGISAEKSDFAERLAIIVALALQALLSRRFKWGWVCVVVWTPTDVSHPSHHLKALGRPSASENPRRCLAVLLVQADIQSPVEPITGVPCIFFFVNVPLSDA